MRQYGEIPAPLATIDTPQALSTSGLGTGGGASVQTPDSGNYGDVMITAGPSVSTSGNVVLQFANTPPTMFIAGDEGFGTITQAHDNVAKTITISWTSATLVPGSRRHRIHYEWFNSTKAN